MAVSVVQLLSSQFSVPNSKGINWGRDLREPATVGAPSDGWYPPPHLRETPEI